MWNNADPQTKATFLQTISNLREKSQFKLAKTILIPTAKQAWQLSRQHLSADPNEALTADLKRKQQQKQALI